MREAGGTIPPRPPGRFPRGDEDERKEAAEGDSPRRAERELGGAELAHAPIVTKPRDATTAGRSTPLSAQARDERSRHLRRGLLRARKVLEHAENHGPGSAHEGVPRAMIE